MIQSKTNNTLITKIRKITGWALIIISTILMFISIFIATTGELLKGGGIYVASQLTWYFNQEKLNQMIKDNNFNLNDGLLFVCDLPDESYEFSSKVISKVGEDLNLIDRNKYEFCWIVDYPMYEKDVLTGKIDFSHNPFSMPQGGMDALTKDDPLNVLAYQYDIVCNGIELSSGAIRNHRPDIMKKAFEIAGYGESEIKSKFSALFDAFHYGVPPHGGCAPGLDRIIMLLSENENIREVIAFPFNQRAQDLMMNAPVKIEDKQLKELNLKKVSD